MADQENWDDLRAKIIGLGELSSRKSYYPELRQKLSDLERFRALLDITADGIFQAEAPDGTIIEINQAAASLFQCKRNDLIGKSIYLFFSSHVSSEIREFNSNVSGANPESISIETSILQNDGSKLIVDLGVQVSIFDTKRYFVITAHNITERIAYQKKLRISEMNMSSIFDSTYDAIIIHDKIGKIIEVNSAMLKSFEVTYEQALQLQIPQISATADQLSPLSVVWENVLAGEPAIFEWKALRPLTKTTFIAEVALKKVFWKGKTEIVAVVRDITARKKIEKDLHQANQFNQEIVAGAGEGIVVYDTNYCYQLWNSFMEKIIGIKETEVLGKKASQLFPHFMGKGIDKILQRIVDGEKEISLEFDFYVPQNGRKGWLDATYVPRHDYNGNVIGIIATMRDVTERRRAVEALRESESLLRTLIENAPFEIWARNKEGIGILENKTIVEHFGSILGKKLHNTAVDKDELSLWNLINQKAFTGEIVNTESEYTIHGEKRFFQQIVAPILSNGKVEGIAGFNIDITNRKLAEIEIGRANRVYALTSKINQMIIQAHDSQTIFKESCRIAVEYGKFRMVWIGLLDEEIHDITPVTWFGFEDGYLAFLQKTTVLKNPLSQGPVALSIRKGKAYFSSDFATDANMLPWRDEALKRGYRSIAALPLKVGGKVIGSFVMNASEPSFFNASEIKLLEEVTGNIEYALDMLEVEKKKQEAEMAFLKERLFTDAVIDSVPGLLYLYDENGYLQRWNKKHTEITGYTSEELDQFYVLNWFKDDSEDREGIKNEIKKTLEEGFGAIEAKLTTKEGLKISFYLTAVRLIIDDKVYFTGIGIDVTERNKALEALVYNEQRLRILSEASFEGILFSENGIIIDSNEQLLTLLGRSKEKTIGHNLLEFVASESLEKVKSKILDNSEEEYELQVTKGDGTIISIESRARMIHTEDRTIRISIIRDMTRYKRLEKELLNSVINTEEKERLNFSQELHDGLGPLLSAAKMYVQWLSKPNAKVDKQEIIPDIEKLLDEAINSIRDISFKISPHILQNFGLVEALEAFAKKIRMSNQIIIGISAEIIPRMDEITETILYRILCECINNTIKHAQANNIDINIEKVNYSLLVFYSDNGKGFDVEQRLQDKKGIGLMSMQSRLKSINGQINFFSTPGKGTDIIIKVKVNTGILPEIS